MQGYRDYGHDLDNLDTLLEAGLGFTADFEKPGASPALRTAVRRTPSIANGLRMDC